MRALQSHARKNSKANLLKYIETEAQLRLLNADHPDIAAALRPNRAEWGSLSRADYFVILNWARNCLGIFFPVFIVTVDNPTDQDLLMTEIKYNIIAIDRVRYLVLPPSGPLTPTASYDHSIDGRLGVQRFAIAPPFRIAPNSSGSFELQLYTDDKAAEGQEFEMYIEYLTNQIPLKIDVFLLRMARRRQ